MESLELNINDLFELEELTKDFTLFPHRRIHGLLIGSHASDLRGRGLDFSEVRKYVQGDDIRNIDWKVTARTQKTHTKVFNEEKQRKQLILLDQSRRMLFGSDVQLKINRGIQLAAIHAFRALKMGDRVAVWAFNEEEMITQPPTSSRNDVAGMLYETLELNLKTQKHQFAIDSKAAHSMHTMLEIADERVSHDYIIQIISDFTLLPDEDIDIITELSEKNDVIVSHIYDPLDRQLPAEKITLSDGTKQISLKSNKGINKEFQKEYDRKIETLKEKLEDFRIPFLTFTTTQTIHEQLVNILTH